MITEKPIDYFQYGHF